MSDEANAGMGKYVPVGARESAISAQPALAAEPGSVRGESSRAYAWLLTLCLALLAVGHVAAWSAFPPDVDAINFTAALTQYDVGVDAPHPPGYPLYVGAARLAEHLVGAGHAYALVNLMMLLLAAVCVYVALRKVGYPRVGLAGAVLLAAHPLAWSATVVPECYAADLLAGCALAAWAAVARRWSALVIAAGAILILDVLGFVRPVSSVMLLPLACGLVFWAARAGRPSKPNGRSAWYAVAATLAFGVVGVTAAWLITAEISAGGITAYRAASARVMGASFHATSFFGGAPLRAHLKMVIKLGGWFMLLAAPALLLAVWPAVRWRIRSEPAMPRRRGLSMRSAAALAGLWILPPFLFYACIYYLKPAYQLIYLAPLLLVAAGCAVGGGRWSGRKKWAGWAAVALLVLGFQGFFWLPAHLARELPEPLYRLTDQYVRDQDGAWQRLESQLAGVVTPHTLVIYRRDARLPATALRLIDGDGPFAVATRGGTRLAYYDHWWVPEAGSAAEYLPGRYDRVAEIDMGADGHAEVRTYPVGSNRRVHDVLAAAAQSATAVESPASDLSAGVLP